MLAREARSGCTLLEHTGDLGLEFRAERLDSLFELAILGLVDVIVDTVDVAPVTARSLTLAADDRELLLVRLLREVLWLYDSERWLPGRAEVRLGVDACTLAATLWGESFDPERHPVKTEVKAVTYHALAIREEPGGFRATVVLDL